MWSKFRARYARALSLAIPLAKFLDQRLIRITQSRFEGIKVGLGAVIYDELGSDVMISNTVFVNNSATHYCNRN